ncbi:hypothetical protein FEM48_Zijuj01G0156200 [Ziziphus jujuba var. spinosa]|uniref:Non-classical arabinogalactan protein 31-like n=1 Tax=Ziziphus jujuba var. spinosa TaxID=714518 RepID=A0A978W233_ZIZJJ|nr:hypothetical protein FEM48_Zijuj01G0156200 [Ziziphus jujuba var. spinosa]
MVQESKTSETYDLHLARCAEFQALATRPSASLALLQLTVVLVSSFSVLGEEIQAVPPIPPHHYPVEAPSLPPSPHHHHHHHHHHPPSVSPALPPNHVPVPVLAPVPAPSPHHHHHHHHGHPPTPAPAHAPTHKPVQSPSHPPSHYAPTHPPAHPPSTSPAHPPSHPPAVPPRRLVAVQGVVYCKATCKYAGQRTLWGAKPLLGGTVRLYCRNTKYSLVLTAKTDKNGYFFITANDKITSYGAHKCKVSLASSPLATCQKAADLHDGFKGAFLRAEKPIFYQKRPYLLYTVGPFLFEPKC